MCSLFLCPLSLWACNQTFHTWNIKPCYNVLRLKEIITAVWRTLSRRVTSCLRNSTKVEFYQSSVTWVPLSSSQRESITDLKQTLVIHSSGVPVVSENNSSLNKLTCYTVFLNKMNDVIEMIQRNNICTKQAPSHRVFLPCIAHHPDPNQTQCETQLHWLPGWSWPLEFSPPPASSPLGPDGSSISHNPVINNYQWSWFDVVIDHTGNHPSKIKQF